MISIKNVVWLKIRNHPNLSRQKHPLVTMKIDKKGRKTFLLGSSNLMRIKQNFGFDSYVTVPDKTKDVNSPFIKTTYIECIEFYYLDNTTISLLALSTPPSLPDNYFGEAAKKARGCGNKMISTNEVIRLNPNICTLTSIWSLSEWKGVKFISYDTTPSS